MTKSNTVVIYHANCPDGFGSAWSFWKKYGNDIEYYPANHGDPPPGFDGKDLFIVDFSYPREILLSLKERANSVAVIDHHLSAQKDLGDLEFCHFDMNHSGAYLAWAHCFGVGPIIGVMLFSSNSFWISFEVPFHSIQKSALPIVGILAVSIRGFPSVSGG